MSGKLLLKLDATAYMLQHHTSEFFPFLTDPANGRNRTTFYNTLGRLLFMEDTPAKFKSFVAPLQLVSRCSVVVVGWWWWGGGSVVVVWWGARSVLQWHMNGIRRVYGRVT